MHLHLTCVTNQHDEVLAADEQLRQEADARGLHRGHKQVGEVLGGVSEGRHAVFPVGHRHRGLVNIVVKHRSLSSRQTEFVSRCNVQVMRTAARVQPQ